MYGFRSYDFHDLVCQKLWRLVQAALSYRRKPIADSFWDTRHLPYHSKIHSHAALQQVKEATLCLCLRDGQSFPKWLTNYKWWQNIQNRTRSSAEKACVTQYHPEGGKALATGWPLYRHIVCGGSKCISRPEGHTALPLLSVFIRLKISKSTWVTGSPSR